MVFNINFYWCNLLVHDANMIIVISVYMRKDINENRKKKPKETDRGRRKVQLQCQNIGPSSSHVCHVESAVERFDHTDKS